MKLASWRLTLAKLIAAGGIAVTAGVLTGGYSSIALPLPHTQKSHSLAEVERLLHQGNFDAALQLLNNLALQTPEPAGVETQLGKIDYEKHAYAKAAEHLHEALKQNPADAEATELLGLCFYMQGDATSAMPLLKQSAPQVPEPLPVTLDILGDAYLQNHQYAKSREVFARMYHVPAESAQGYLVNAQMMIRHDMAGEAVPELQKAIAMDSKLSMAHLLLGEVYLAHSRVNLALQEFRQEISLNPVQWLAYWRMGDAYSRLGDLIQSEQALEKSIWIDPNFTGPYILLGRVELRKGDPSLAARFLEHAIKMDPNNFSAHYLLGEAYEQLGRKAQANHEFALTRSLHAEKDQH